MEITKETFVLTMHSENFSEAKIFQDLNQAVDFCRKWISSYDSDNYRKTYGMIYQGVNQRKRIGLIYQDQIDGIICKFNMVGINK